MAQVPASSESHTTLDRYLALIPRGLEHAARENLLEVLSDFSLRLKVVGEVVSDNDNIAHISNVLQRKKDKNKDIIMESCFGGFAVGSIHENKNNWSVGYIQQSKPTWSCSGVIHGVVWLQIETNAPAHLIANRVRCLGPIIALVNIWEPIDMPASQSLEQAVASVKALVDSDSQQEGDYSQAFLAARTLWFRHVQAAWNLPEEDLKALDNKLKGTAAMKYRLSCIRSDSEKYQYTRQQLLAQTAGIVVPKVQGEPWTVDLTKYDLEVVVLAHPKALAVGIALRPYQHLGVKSFATGAIPPDVTAPLEPGDVVLDPCAGVGTIPMEVLFQEQDAIAVGGDIALTGLGGVAAEYSTRAHALRRERYPSHSARYADQMAWDATCLPLRDATVDVLVSDLPFGVQCLSKAKLDSVLPLMFSEFARVLRPRTGRLVLLCGNCVPIVRVLHQLNTGKDSMSSAATAEDIISMPCDSVFPVNIGGLMAWVVIVKRDNGPPRELPNYKDRVRKVAGKRERIERCKANDKSTKKRGVHQS
ncbi:THUMP domain-containing protein 3 [Seminavis robusta]|uniref:THUMP domain-containing protein 3 n=1 Tax=Seminavis robusta TaxID=568900 RepID=A0A9N8E531_9STRA|nr:THUMP domain-containing protein 3 [Seminavis robusta]|eukprot:Sro625_g177680.1 THUMP domain-containing protein 3 (532) ;mRNA; r:49454-51228